MLKVCDLFNANRYVIPRREEIQSELKKIQEESRINQEFLIQAQRSILEFISIRAENPLSQPGKYDLYRKFFKKEKLIQMNLNKCLVTQNLVIGEVWIPEEKFNEVKSNLDKYAESDPNSLAVTFDEPSHETDSPKIPPTYFKTNDLIYPFQEIVNTYGIPRYQEANPALFCVVTFPFLFGVMFGDIGHGFLLFLFAFYLCWNKESLKKSKSALAPALKARYLLLFMGFFAFYSGWLYNDFLSIPLNIFGSCYRNPDQELNSVEKTQSLIPNKAERIQDCTYPFGLDPKWYVASNELAYFNSLKMKLSVVLGVTQMTFGIILRGINNLFFNNIIDFVFEFIPQLIFMTTLFGYMIFMIFVKWATDWSEDTSKAPNIISILMNIFLKKGSVDGKPLIISTNFQESLNFWVLIICLICIPFVLFPKPFIIHSQMKKKEKEDSHNEEHGLSDLFVHQAIETIELVLSSVSNTASYLRLWALSLAHAQLAKVFFEKALLGFVQEANIIFVIIGFFIFANVTFGVLMCMDLMECFLHTLRLHWVEFQNKFFKADGVKFVPFSFIDLIEESN
jgi:V-type H+-transporting ATPase subunit a